MLAGGAPAPFGPGAAIEMSSDPAECGFPDADLSALVRSPAAGPA